MKIETILLSILLVTILLVGCTQQQSPPQGNQTPPNTTPTTDELCAQAGGTVTTQFCCKSVGDFPNTCLVGACGCSHDNSHNVKVCNCGEGKCWDSTKSQCVALQAQPGNNPQQPTLVDMSNIYQYASLHSYTYEIISAGTATNLSTTISSDTVNGTAAWLQQTDMTTQGATVTSKTWVDKVTYKCLKITTVMTYSGQTIEQPSSCPTTGPNSASRTGTETPQLTYVGIESVTVPAGTFSCTKYSLEGVTFWVANGLPLPVKIAFDSGASTMELVSYN